MKSPVPIYPQFANIAAYNRFDMGVIILRVKIKSKEIWLLRVQNPPWYPTWYPTFRFNGIEGINSPVTFSASHQAHCINWFRTPKCTEHPIAYCILAPWVVWQCHPGWLLMFVWEAGCAPSPPHETLFIQLRLRSNIPIWMPLLVPATWQTIRTRGHISPWDICRSWLVEGLAILVSDSLLI